MAPDSQNATTAPDGVHHAVAAWTCAVTRWWLVVLLATIYSISKAEVMPNKKTMLQKRTVWHLEQTFTNVCWSKHSIESPYHYSSTTVVRILLQQWRQTEGEHSPGLRRHWWHCKSWQMSELVCHWLGCQTACQPARCLYCQILYAHMQHTYPYTYTYNYQYYY